MTCWCLRKYMTSRQWSRPIARRPRRPDSVRSAFRLRLTHRPIIIINENNRINNIIYSQFLLYGNYNNVFGKHIVTERSVAEIDFVERLRFNLSYAVVFDFRAATNRTVFVFLFNRNYCTYFIGLFVSSLK